MPVGLLLLGMSGVTEPDSNKCGTYAGYQIHNRRKTPPCDACREANRLYQKERRKDPYIHQEEVVMNKIRSRALWRLVDLHRDEFKILVEEEIQREQS